mmetsp:Transcript_50854/g.121100  ORF Transcript_50854/g.121100 Transcript_50854/m.121100 type:complete len:318 (+) Transcript_50854:74-1027(+)
MGGVPWRSPAAWNSAPPSLTLLPMRRTMAARRGARSGCATRYAGSSSRDVERCRASSSRSRRIPATARASFSLHCSSCNSLSASRSASSRRRCTSRSAASFCSASLSSSACIWRSSEPPRSSAGVLAAGLQDSSSSSGVGDGVSSPVVLRYLGSLQAGQSGSQGFPNMIRTICSNSKQSSVPDREASYRSIRPRTSSASRRRPNSSNASRISSSSSSPVPSLSSRRNAKCTSSDSFSRGMWEKMSLRMALQLSSVLLNAASDVLPACWDHRELPFAKRNEDLTTEKKSSTLSSRTGGFGLRSAFLASSRKRSSDLRL